MAKKPAVETPNDILTMSLEQLQAHSQSQSEKIEEQEKTIEELMSKVASLDAEPKVKTATIKIGKVEHKLLVPKSYIRTAEGEPMELCTIETCKENETVQQAAIAKGLLVPVTE